MQAPHTSVDFATRAFLASFRMTAEQNPYAPPRDEREIDTAGSHAMPGTITCNVVLEVRDLAQGLASGAMRADLVVASELFLMGLAVGAWADAEWPIWQGFQFVAIGSLIRFAVRRFKARRPLANQSVPERTVTYRFSPDAIEITTSTTDCRVQWHGVHRFAEGPKTFSFYPSEANIQVVPKRALRSDDVAAVR